MHYLSRTDQYHIIPGDVAQFPDELKGIHVQVLPVTAAAPLVEPGGFFYAPPGMATNTIGICLNSGFEMR